MLDVAQIQRSFQLDMIAAFHNGLADFEFIRVMPPWVGSIIVCELEAIFNQLTGLFFQFDNPRSLKQICHG